MTAREPVDAVTVDATVIGIRRAGVQAHAVERCQACRALSRFEPALLEERADPDVQSDADVARVVREGVLPDGRSTLGMPSTVFHPLSDEDLGAIMTAEQGKPLFESVGEVAYGASFYFMALVLRFMPVGIVYAIWSGLGIVFIALIGGELSCVEETEVE